MRALVIFGGSSEVRKSGYDTVIEGADLEVLVGPGSIDEAATLLEELPHLTFADGTPVRKALSYRGFDLWWMHYDSLFIHFCLPYTRYRPLLMRLRGCTQVDMHGAPHPALFRAYLEAYGIETTLHESRQNILPMGVMLQITLSLLYLPFLMLLRRRILLYTGDKFEAGRDHDFRLRYIYEELRERRMPFAEFIRGLERWNNILRHAWVRRRPVFYTDTAIFLGRFSAVLSGARSRAWRAYGVARFASAQGDERFKQLLAIQYLRGAAEDIWAIRILRTVLSLIGTKAAYITGGSERTVHTLLACKTLGIPTVGILHGVSTRRYVVSDFMPGYDGEKRLSVDLYGVWSEWWREYLLREGNAYGAEQLVVSGPMRPLVEPPGATALPQQARVLFVSEQKADPAEVVPYLEALLDAEVPVTIKFRPYRDGFKNWLAVHRPDLLAQVGVEEGTMQEAFKECDIAVGSFSTGVLESLLVLKTPIFFRTMQWGDYYDLEGTPFFAATPPALVARIAAARDIPRQEIERLRDRYFGDPHKNGSAWVVDQLQGFLQKR